MFVRCKKRFKDGKEHRYWSVVENVRVRGGRVVQRHVLYLGEINDSQRAAWCRSIEVVEGKSRSRQMALFSRGSGGVGAGLRGGEDQRLGGGASRSAPVGGVLARAGLVGPPGPGPFLAVRPLDRAVLVRQAAVVAGGLHAVMLAQRPVAPGQVLGPRPCCGGRVGGVVAEPLPSQSRASGITALGSSHASFAQTGDVSALLIRAGGRGNRRRSTFIRSQLT